MPGAVRRWGLRSALAFALVAGIALVGSVVHGPFGRTPGGPLLGERVDAPVEDWSFADRESEIQVQTRLPVGLPYSVTTWSVTDGGRLFVSADFGNRKLWVRQVRAHPDGFVRVAGRVYPVRFREVDSEAARQRIGRLEVEKYMGGDPPEAAVPPGEVIRFELVSRSAR